MAAVADRPGLSASEALARLVEGHRRFVEGRGRPPLDREELLRQLNAAQRPFATVLACSDARVPPELVFDAAPGELFVIRIAGNVFSPEIAGSLQYAGSHLRTPLFVVMGHEGCGAIEAAMAARFQGAVFRSRIELLLARILPGLPAPDPALPAREALSRAVEANVLWSLRQIEETPEAQASMRDLGMRAVGAVFEHATARIRWVERPGALATPGGAGMRVEVDDLSRPQVRSLLQEHVTNMHQLSPRESVHALDLDALRHPDITFWTVWEGDTLLGCGALRALDATHGEVKSMRTPAALRRRGAGRAVLAHIVAEARARGYRRLSLETGAHEAFLPAQRLYERFGFVRCGPFGSYRPDPNSVFMTLPLSHDGA